MSTIEQDPSIETSSREPALNQEPEESSGKTGLGTARFWLVFGPDDSLLLLRSGNFLVVSATTATIIGRTWGGVRYPWSSWHVLVPLVLGFVGLAGFLVYEANFPVEPVVPWKLLANRATLAGYLVTFFIASLPPASRANYVPTYLQAVKGESAIRSGVVFLASAATIAPGAIICGASVTILKIYRPQNMIDYIGYQIIGGIGLGILYPVVQFPVLASPPLSETAHALALFTFIRQFATTWGITIGSTIPQNGLTKNLPHSVITEVSATTSGSVHNEIAYVIIPLISGLQEPLKTQTQVAFATSLRLIWHVLLGVCGLGLLSVLLMKEVPMQEVTSDEFGMKDKKVKGEKAMELDEKTMTTVASSVLWGAVVYCGGGSFGLRSQLTGLVMQRPCYPRIELSHPSN
ncbi:hypothetical protein FRB97_005748 [Tulasnella sp. 331]|nr:hypothetical protein FRB97_005748 [Tulasnella sp. 331]